MVVPASPIVQAEKICFCADYVILGCLKEYFANAVKVIRIALPASEYLVECG
jgi:hypothetical protein